MTPARRGRGPAQGRSGAAPTVRARRAVESATVSISGRRAVAEALRAGRAVELRVERGSRRTEGMRAVLEHAGRLGIPVRLVDRAEIHVEGMRDQGVVALIRALEEVDERALRSMPFAPEAIAVILDGVMDPQNLGACARSAEAAGAALLVTRKRRAAPLSAAAVRASAGALAHLPVARVANIARVVGTFADRGFTVVGLDHGAPVTIHDAPRPDRPLALVVGSEDAGLSRLVRERCHLLVAIPMMGRTASLNASAALAVALFCYAGPRA